MTDPAKVAAGLTELQRYVVLHMGADEYPRPSPEIRQHELRAMEGLLWTICPREMLPLGLAVRAHLLRKG